MKTLLLLTLLVSTQLFGNEVKHLQACGEYAAQDLTEEHAEWDHSYYMLNADQKIIGAFLVKGDQVQAQVCEYIAAENITVANEWYYWNTDVSANPADWKLDIHYWVAQDEGTAYFQVLKTSATGEVTIQFSVTGINDYGDDVELRSDVLTFKQAY